MTSSLQPTGAYLEFQTLEILRCSEFINEVVTTVATSGRALKSRYALQNELVAKRALRRMRCVLASWASQDIFWSVSQLVLPVHHPSFSCNVTGPYIVDLHVPVEAGILDWNQRLPIALQIFYWHLSTLNSQTSKHIRASLDISWEFFILISGTCACRTFPGQPIHCFRPELTINEMMWHCWGLSWNISQHLSFQFVSLQLFTNWIIQWFYKIMTQYEQWDVEFEVRSWVMNTDTVYRILGYSRRVAALLASLMLRGLGCSSNGWSRVLPHHGRTAGTNATATPPPPSNAVAVSRTQGLLWWKSEAESGDSSDSVIQRLAFLIFYLFLFCDLVSQWIGGAVSHEDSKAPWPSQKRLVGTSRYRGRIGF